jgi:hypothetical protein
MNNNLNNDDRHHQLSSDDAQKIIERLELQLLLAVIIFFISGWAVLNKTICNFTEAESLNSQMGYILVHYVLTIVLCLCLYITYVKGKYIIDTNSINKEKNDYYYSARAKYFRLFMNSWLFILISCLATLALTSHFSWWLFGIALIVSIFILCCKVDFYPMDAFILVFCIICFFPLFISTMTLVNKHIDIVFDKEYYCIDDDVLITVESKGYACSHKLVCIAENTIYPNPDSNLPYDTDGNLIAVKALAIKGNGSKRLITVGTVTPASGYCNFLRYPIYKMLGKKVHYIDASTTDNRQFVNYSSEIVNIKL